MERESFEDQEVAAILNEHYISIKVDREERPDVDTIYMAVCTAMTGHGGWPLTIIMTPEKKPFFAGTYFPKNSMRGMPGLTEILLKIAQAWVHNRQEILESGDNIVQAMEKSQFEHSPGDISDDILHKAYKHFERSFDPQYGGFGQAPKFPTPHNLSFLLRYWKMTREAKALEIVEKTLDSMYRGGIYDHIGFGFARYSTDGKWLVPHFEKMLYDNALLALVYTEAYLATGKEVYAKTVKEIFTYVLRDMTSPEGAFYSAEDADSEGEEGKFYVWSPEEIREVLGDQLGEVFCRDFDITPGGNFEGKSIPNLIKTGQVKGLEDAGNRLFLARENRVHPHKDDKILTAWNGLMIAALAFGSRALGESGLAEAARRAADFIFNNLRREDGRLLARYRDGEAAYPAYVDDYAFLIWGLIELYQASFEPRYLQWALELNDDLLRYFWDQENSGLFQYGSDSEKLITRPKEIYDGAMPSGNSVAALNFLRLGKMTGDPDLEEKAKAMFKTFGGTVAHHPGAYSHFLTALYFATVPTTEVTIVGDTQAEDTLAMLELVNKNFSPEIVLMVKNIHTNSEILTRLVTSIAGRESIEGKAAAYVCKDFSCRPPVTDPDELAALLSN